MVKFPSALPVVHTVAGLVAVASLAIVDVKKCRRLLSDFPTQFCLNLPLLPLLPSSRLTPNQSENPGVFFNLLDHCEPWISLITQSALTPFLDLSFALQSQNYQICPPASSIRSIRTTTVNLITFTYLHNQLALQL